MAHIVFVHGIGTNPRPDRMLPIWKDALGRGMRTAGHDDLADRMSSDPSFTWALAGYADLFSAAGSQGLQADDTDDEEELTLALEFLEALAYRIEREASLSTADLRLISSAKFVLAEAEPSQGVGAVVKRLLNATTSLLALPGLRAVSGWMTGALMLSDLRQVSRYLRRGELDGSSKTLDARIRRRVAEHLDESTIAVIAHSLGSIVAFESLHELAVPVPLFVTLGSPLAVRSVVFDRLIFPRRTPDRVAGWLNVWDKDDIIAIRPDLRSDFAANAAGVIPTSVRIDSDGLWVHTATKYLTQPALAGPVASAIRAHGHL